MKHALVLASLAIAPFLFAPSEAKATVYIQYYNKDSQVHKFKVLIGGMDKEVEFGNSRTSSVTIQGGGNTCVIETKCGKIEVKDGAKVEIKDGCIKIM
ncbi:MAG: hypothetical protein EAZ92_11100 [Candidatus Kapaibacterium sp.]|nr:MAG: hypothetical protein EAZ92_11100 [Candidatus Kapabacteria bacterium]